MSEEAKKEYDNEMRGSLWTETERTNDKAPAATGTLTVSGVDLRIAMWPKRTAKVKGVDRVYWPISVEYKQGVKCFLAKVNPANVIVTGAAAEASSGSEGGDAAPDAVSDIPF